MGADFSTPGLVIAGAVTAIGTALTTVYSAWRNARHDADARDASLARTELERARARILELEQQVRRWETIWKAHASGSHDES